MSVFCGEVEGYPKLSGCPFFVKFEGYPKRWGIRFLLGSLEFLGEGDFNLKKILAINGEFVFY